MGMPEEHIFSFSNCSFWNRAINTADSVYLRNIVNGLHRLGQIKWKILLLSILSDVMVNDGGKPGLTPSSGKEKPTTTRHSAACRPPLAIFGGGRAERKRREKTAASAYAQHCNSRAKWTKS